MTAPDQIEGAPHPKDTLRLFGQSSAETEFLNAYNAGRLHHGWLLTVVVVVVAVMRVPKHRIPHLQQ